MTDIDRVLRAADPMAGCTVRPLSPADITALAQEIVMTSTLEAPTTSPSPVLRRRTVLRWGAAAVAVAAAATTAVVLTRTDTPAPRAGLSLVAAEELTFPLSVDPVPAGMTPTFTGGADGGAAIADYTSADDLDRFTVLITPDDPDTEYGDYQQIEESGTVTVAGTEASYVAGTLVDLCDQAGCADRAFADLVWERGDGRWVSLQGQGRYGDVGALVGVGDALVDRSQPVDLQAGLIPAGWSAVEWHNGTDLTLADDADPDSTMAIQVLPADDGRTVDGLVAAVTPIDPVVATTVAGRPAQLVHAHDYVDADLRFWLLAWGLPDGTVVSLQAPDGFTAADVLAIAGQVTCTP